jgi:hypothetical protein
MKLSTGVQFNYFEESFFGKYNFWSSRNSVYGQWKFLPKTAAFFNVSFIYQDYFNAGATRDDQRTMPLSAFVGVLGQLTPKISLKLSGGYANSLSKDMHHDGIVGAEFIFKNSENTLFKLGYLRTMFPVATYQYYAEDKVYIGLYQKFFNRLLLQLDASYAHFAYGKNVRYPTKGPIVETETSDLGAITTTTITQKSVDREDHRIVVEPSISYNIYRWLGIGLKYTFETRQTPYFFAQNRVYTHQTNATLNQDTTTTAYYDYMDHRIMLTAAVDY